MALARLLQGAKQVFLRIFLGPRVRRLSRKVLEYGARDLGIDWPVKVEWRSDIRRRGQVEPRVKYEIQVRVPQNTRETAQTIFHELYHLAQFHKWRDLHPEACRDAPGDLARADALAELYAQVTTKSFWRENRSNVRAGKKRFFWKRGERIPILPQ